MCDASYTITAHLEKATLVSETIVQYIYGTPHHQQAGFQPLLHNTLAPVKNTNQTMTVFCDDPEFPSEKKGKTVCSSHTFSPVVRRHNTID